MKSVRITTYRNNGIKAEGGGFVVIGDNGQLPADVATKDWVIAQEFVSLDQLGEKLAEYVTKESLTLVLGEFWKKDELIRDGLYLKFIEGYIKSKYADEAGNAEHWDHHLFDSYLNQAVKTDSNVIHKTVTAQRLIEEDAGAGTPLMQELIGNLGDLENVDPEADTALTGSILVKGVTTWSPMFPTFSSVDNYNKLLMPVFNTLTRQWIFIAVPGGVIVPPPGGFPYVFPVTL